MVDKICIVMNSIRFWVKFKGDTQYKRKPYIWRKYKNRYLSFKRYVLTLDFPINTEYLN